MSRITRRRFVRTSATSAVAVSAMSKLARAQSPNDTVGAAVVGVGGRGRGHLEAFVYDSRTQVVCVVEVDDKIGNTRCDQIEEKQGRRPKLVSDLRAAFDDGDVDVVSTATPNHWHALCGVWAMQAGKDVYIEKPISHNIAEGSALITAAAKYGRMCQVGTQCRSNQAVQQAMAFIHDGGIGDVNFARGLCYKRRKSIGPLGDYAIPDNVDFNLWSGPAPFTDPRLTRQRFHYDWHWQRHYGNGDSGNQGPHQTDIARWGLQKDSHPYGVISYGGRLGYQAEREDDSYVDAGDTANTQISIYDYGDKCMVFETRGLDISNSDDTELNRLFQSTEGNKVGVVFYGSSGYLVQKSYSHCIAYDLNLNVIKEFQGGGNHFENFISACIHRDAGLLNADAREGHLSATLSHLGNISYYLGQSNKTSADDAASILAGVKSLDDNDTTLERTIKHLRKNNVDLADYPLSVGPFLEFDPVDEVFPNSPEATEMIGRSYRDGFACPTADSV